MGREDFWFLARLRRGGRFENPVTELKRSQKPKRSRFVRISAHRYRFDGNALSRRLAISPRRSLRLGTRFNPEFRNGNGRIPRCDLVAGRHKAVLKHAQSKCWREVRCGPANAERLDCVRFIAAVSRRHPTRSTGKIRRGGSPTSGCGLIRDSLPKIPTTGKTIFPSRKPGV